MQKRKQKNMQIIGNRENVREQNHEVYERKCENDNGEPFDGPGTRDRPVLSTFFIQLVLNSVRLC